MSILVDSQIAALCQQPNVGISSNDGKGTETLVYMTEAEISKHVQAVFIGGPENKGIGTLRRLSVKEVATSQRLMITPFVNRQIRDQLNNMIIRSRERSISIAANYDGDEVYNASKVISYGLSSMGYDLRIDRKFKIFTNVNSTVIDPKNFSEKNFVDFEGDICIIPPNSFVLAVSLEYLVMPDDVAGVVLGKSTYARCGVDCLATPLEPGWEGHVTLEFANTTPLPAVLYAGEGACQVIFHKGDCRPDITYSDRGGKYQGQTGITLPKA